MNRLNGTDLVTMPNNLEPTEFVFSRKYKPLMAALAAIGFLCSAEAYAANPTAPAPSTAASASDPFKDLKGLERRFFFHEYDHDPLEKRLERIELLVFGAAQDGQNTDRLKRLRDAVATRDKEAAQRLAEKNRAVKPGLPTAKTTAPTSSSQYPILQTLEWRALQKTYGSESLDQRLDRLETSLLGQPSPAMSYADRIERLKKMIGVETASSPTPKITPLPKGPAPRAQARRLTPFSSPYVIPVPRSEWQEGEEGFDSTFEDDLRQQMNNDLRTMMDMMQRMNRMPGFRVPGQGGGNGRGMIVPVPGDGMTPFVVPSQPSVPKRPKVPPYADPNSI